MQETNWSQGTPPPSAPPELAPAEAAPGLLSRVVAVFTAPGRAMEAVKRDPRWLVPGLIIMAVLAIFASTTVQIAGPEQMEMMRDSKLGRMMSTEQFQKAQDDALNPTTAKRVTSAISGAAGGWIAIFLTGLVFLLFTKLAGGQGTLKQVMGVVFWASLISFGLGSLVKLPLVFAKKSVMEVSTGLGLLSSGGPLALSHQLLSIFDVFQIWSLAVIVIGFEKIHGFARNKAIVVTVLPWLLMSFVMIGIGRLFL